MSDDFMGGMFDFNNDGHTDAGEEYAAYKIFEDCTKGSGRFTSPRSTRCKMDTGEIVVIIMLVYAVLDLIGKLL